MNSDEGEQPTSTESVDVRVENKHKDFIIDLLDEHKHVFRESDIKIIEFTRPMNNWAGLQQG